MRAIAELAGCSPSTVSRVLSGNYGTVRVSQALRSKIRKICAELGYEPNVHASRLFGKRTGIVGLVLPHVDGGLHDENLSLFTNAAYEALNAADYRLLLLMMNEPFVVRQDHLSLVRRREVDGLIVWGAVGETDWLDELAAAGMPLMLGINRSGDHPCIYCDDAAGMAAMVGHCRERGAKRLVYVDGPPAPDCARRRHDGFVAAATGCEYRVVSGDFSIAGGRQAAVELARELPDAVVCASDRIAMGVIMGLRQAGIRVPDDVLVTGADNTELAEFAHPALTSYDQMATTCGRTCARMLLDHLAEGTALKTRVIAPEVHIRESA